MGALTHNGDVITGLPSTASQINYDNTSSGMAATQVQAAVDELRSALTNKATIPVNSATLIDTIASGTLANIPVLNDGYLSIWCDTGTTSLDFVVSVRHNTLPQYGVFLTATVSAYSSEAIGGLFVKKGEIYTVRNAGANEIKVYLCK